MDDFKDVLEEPDYRKYYKYIIMGIIALILIIILLVTIFSKDEKEVKKKPVESVNVIEEKVEEIPKEEEKIYFRVDIKGEVNTPGVYELEEGRRIIDVINMAGGLKEQADTSLINLSKKITDEMVIIIYNKDEIAKQKEENIEYVYIEKECVCPDNLNDACINVEENTSKVEDNKEELEEDNSLVSINKATIEELQTLTGIGESKAKSIIEYREENGDFKTIEDIKNVSGIGDALYEKIKDSITV